MGKHELRFFRCNPYEITLGSGEVCRVDDEIVGGELRPDGSFLGAVFSDGQYEGEVDYGPADARERLGRELFLTEAEE